jgi:hypothetical protein
MVDYAERSCPVCLAYLQELRSVTMLDELLHADVLQQLVHLEEQARVAGGARELQQLRGFVCVEAISSYVGVGALKNAMSDMPMQVKDRADRLKFSRSWEGLTKLLEEMEDIAEELEADGIDIRISRDPVEKTMVQMQTDYINDAIKVYELCYRAAEKLRPALRNNELPIAPVARVLAQACEVAREPTAVRVRWGQKLIDITTYEAPRSWEM